MRKIVMEPPNELGAIQRVGFSAKRHHIPIALPHLESSRPSSKNKNIENNENIKNTNNTFTISYAVASSLPPTPPLGQTGLTLHLLVLFTSHPSVKRALVG